MKIYGIKYLPIDKIVYIGQTIQKGKKRFYDHFRKSKSREKTDKFHTFLFDKDIKDFDFIILADNIETKEELNQLEEYYIEKYNTQLDGYNTYSKSETVNLNRYGKRVKWFDNNKNYICTFNSIIEAESKTGVNCSNIINCCNHIQTKTSKGWFLFEEDESILKDSYRLGTSLKVQKLDPFTFEVIKVYDSLKQAEESENITKGYLSEVCNGNKYNAKGFIYQYEDENLRVPYKKNSKKTGVAQVDIKTKRVLGRFLSCKECADILKLNLDSIRRGRNLYPQPRIGYLWVKADEYKNLIDKGEVIEDENTKIYY